MGTKRQPNFKVDVKDKTYYGWLLTKRECYQTETYGQYEYVRIYIKKLYYFVDMKGNLWKFLFRLIDDAGDIVNREEIVEAFSDEDYYLFDCPAIFINKLVGEHQDTYIDNTRFDRYNPFYTIKGQGVLKTLDSALNSQL